MEADSFRTRESAVRKLTFVVVLRVAVAALVLSACGADVGTSHTVGIPPPSQASSEAASQQPNASTGAPVAGDGEYEPGSYRVASGDATAVPFTFTVPAGWIGENGGQTLSKRPNEDGEVGINSYIVSDIDSDSCSSGEPVPVGPLAGDLATALMQQPSAAASGPVDISLDSYPGHRIDLTIPADLDLASCRLGSVGLHIWEAAGGKNFVLYNGGSASVYTADVDDGRAVLSAQWKNSSTPADIAELDAIIESIEFGP